MRTCAKTDIRTYCVSAGPLRAALPRHDDMTVVPTVSSDRLAVSRPAESIRVVLVRVVYQVIGLIESLGQIKLVLVMVLLLVLVLLGLGYIMYACVYMYNYI